MHEEVADHPLFTGSIPVGIMSGEKPRFPSAGDHEALLRDLQQMGVQHEDTTGRYGEPERSVVVYGLPREQMVALGKKYGQESVIHSEGGRHHLIYTNGPNAGHYHEDVPGSHQYFPSGSPEPADNYTKLPGGGYFRIGFDFDRMHPEAGGGAEVPRGAAAGPVTKHELGHKLWAAVSEVLAKADPPYRIEDLAGEYAQGAGLPYAAPTQQHVTDEGLLHHVGAAYMGSPDMLRDADTRRSYDALKRDTLAQYEFLKRKGFRFTPVAGNATPHSFPAEGFDPKARTDFAYLDDKGKELGGAAPYDRDFSNLYDDVWRNKALKVFTGGAAPAGHPLAEQLPGNDPLGTYNNAFRAVHDVFGHALGVERFNRLSGRKAGYDFGHVGEDHAFSAQYPMYSPEARHALAAETRGQNAAFHFGPNGKQNRANPATAVYPEQKAISLPHQLATPDSPVRKSLNLNVQERSAVADDQKPSDPRMALHGLYKTLREEVEVYEAECVALRKAESARLEKKAPPGFSEDTMHELKRKHGTESAFKIAWAAYDKKSGRKPVKKGEMVKASATDGGMGDEGAAGFAMSEDDARAESYAKGEMDLCKACGLKKGPKHDCDEVEAYAKGELSMEKGSLKDEGNRFLREQGRGFTGRTGEASHDALTYRGKIRELTGSGPRATDRARERNEESKKNPAPLPKSEPAAKSTKEEDADWEADKVQAQLDSKKKQPAVSHPYRKDELEKMGATTLGPRGGGSPGGIGPSTPPVSSPMPAPAEPPPGPGVGKMLPGEIAKDEDDGDGARAPKTDHGSQLPAGVSPTSPGPKPGVVPSTKESKIALPQTKEGGNGLTKEPIKKAGMPAAPSAAGAAAPKAPKLPGIKAPKLPGMGKPAAAAAPKTPPMGAGTPAPNLKAEPDPITKAGPSSLGPRAMEARKKFGERTQQEQAAKLPGVRASVGGLMDNMLAAGPLNPGQPLAIKPIASAPSVPVGVRPSPTGGQAPAPKPAAAIPMVQRVAASLTAPPPEARAGAKLPGAHLFAPKPTLKSEDKPSKDLTPSKEHDGPSALCNDGACTKRRVSDSPYCPEHGGYTKKAKK